MQRGTYNTRAAIDRFRARVVPDSHGCWNWQGGSQPYGKFYMDGKDYSAHRAAIILLTDTPLPNELTVDHLCSNTRCVNPQHLEVVTAEENVRRAARRDGHMWAGDPLCAKGHDMVESNIVMVTSSEGRKKPRCRRCRNDYKKKARGTL